MTSVVAQAYSVPVGKIEFLAVELRLLKAATEQMADRLDSLLIEIADLQREHTARDKHEDGTQSDVMSVDSEEALSAAALPIPAPSTDAPGPIAGEDTEACSTDASATGIVAPPVGSVTALVSETETEATLPASALIVREIAAETTAVIQSPVIAAEPEPTAAPLPATADPSPVIVLSERRAKSTVRPRPALRIAGRWAAAVTLIAALATIAITSAGLASRDGIQPTIERACAFGPDICAFVRSLSL